jgi:thiol-disulfide isomerase/thioredoxin
MGLFDLGSARLVRIAAASAWMALLWRGVAVGLVLLPEAASAAPPQAAAEAPKGQTSPRADSKESVSAAALMQAVYNGQSWLDKARSFRIRAEQKNTRTEEDRRWQEKHPMPGLVASSDDADPRPLVVKIEWAWDEHRVRRTDVSYRDESQSRRDTRVWDGSLAVACIERPDRKEKRYVLGNKVNLFFGEIIVNIVELPWAPGGPHDLWWRPMDVEAARAGRGVAPEDFELEGQEMVNGRRCRVVLSRPGHYRMHIGISDGRLYRQTWLMARPGKAGYDDLALYRKLSGANIKSWIHWEAWLGSLGPAERRRVFRQWMVAELEFARPLRVQTFDDYREVAPGCWLPFRQSIDDYNLDAPEPFLASHSEQTVTEIEVNQPLADDLFRIELADGVPVSTDWRYDPPISYTYRKDQTEAERLALCESKRAARAKTAETMKKRQEVIEGRMGQAPPPLPQSGWLNGGPLAWKDLRGKVVVLHFWAVDCPPCENELPELAAWHEGTAKSGIVVIGIHPPTKDLGAVGKKLADFRAKYPVLIDAAATKPGGVGVLHDWFGNPWWPHTVLVNKRGIIAAHGQLFMQTKLSDELRRLVVEEE